jgi:N-acetylmuramoyl-L-alanine amidase
MASIERLFAKPCLWCVNLLRMSCFLASSRSPLRRLLSRSFALLPLALGLWLAETASASGPQGFRTVIIDAGHGGLDRGGGPGQRIPESLYTLDTAKRLEGALRVRGFRTVMTRNRDVFVTLRDRVAIANSYRNAVFVSVHYNSGAREGAHGFETYYYRSDSYGLAARLHRAQLSSLNTEDRHVRRRGFYVIRNTSIPSVLTEGGFLTNSDEARYITSASYRQRWAENIANALAEQSRQGNPSSYYAREPVVDAAPELTYTESRTSYRTSSYSRSSRSVSRSSRSVSRSRSSYRRSSRATVRRSSSARRSRSSASRRSSSASKRSSSASKRRTPPRRQSSHRRR